MIFYNIKFIDALTKLTDDNIFEMKLNPVLLFIGFK